MAYFDHQIGLVEQSDASSTSAVGDGGDNSASNNDRERQGWMHCYCFKQLTKDPASLFDIDFSDVRIGDTTKYCQQWFISYTKAMTLKYGSPLIIILINMLVPMIFAQFS